MALTFREKKVDKGMKKRIVILISVFFVFLIFFEFILNYEKHGDTLSASEATLPVVATKAGGREVNFMYGFTKKMDKTLCLGPETPISGNKIDLSVYTYEMSIDNAEYQLLKIEDQKVVSSGSIELKGDRSLKEASIDFENIESGRQYFLVIKLSTKDKNLRYYSRVVSGSENGIRGCMDFADSIHKAAIGKDRTTLSSYMESASTAVDNSLDHVNITSSIDQTAYNSLDLEQDGASIYSVNEYLNGNMEITINSILKDKNNPAIKYSVTEYMRTKYSTEKMRLMDYDRHMEKIFDPDNTKVAEQSISVGIADKDLNFISNETGNIVAFVMNGSVYEYNQNTGVITSLYSFTSKLENIRYTSGYQGHGIRLLSIDEGGSVSFTVYGYMSSGAHEGNNGIGVYHYDDGRKVTEEDIFINSDASYQFLKQEYSDSLYISGSDKYYIMSDDKIYEMSADKKKTKVILAGLKEGQYIRSKNSRFVSWSDSKAGSDKITTMDLEDGSKMETKADGGDYIFPLVYMQQDLVYGKAKKEDIVNNPDGSITAPMYEIDIAEISDKKVETEKTYPQNGVYVTSVVLDGSSLTLNRVTRTGKGLVDAGQDVIKNTFEEGKKTVSFETDFDSKAGTIRNFVMGKKAGIHAISSLKAKAIMTADENNFELDIPSIDDKYIIIVGDKIVSIENDLLTAIQNADKINGTVIDSRQKTVWAKSRKDYCSNIEVTSSDMDIMMAKSKKGVKYLDLTGCTMKQMFFYVSNRYPVYTETKNGSYLIIGYDALGVTTYDQKSGSYQTTTRSNLENMIQQKGNIFRTYTD
jgi:ribosomal protein S17E